MARILISGASGFIGAPLSQFLLSQGHVVFHLVRSPSIKGSSEVVWNPEKGEANSADFSHFDWVIHLAGEPLTLNRWSEEKEKKIFESRVQGTMFLSHLLAECSHPPKLFISASAVGFYGDQGERPLTEESGPGSGFLAHVCTAWEKGSLSLERIGVRVAAARFGMVLDAKGGALQKMLLPFRLGLGGRLGSGKQWMSWIDRDDLIGALYHIAAHESLQGPVNVVSPHPVRQEEFAQILAHLLRRPRFCTIPTWALRLRFGKVADELILASAKVIPAKLIASNFSFRYPDLRSALLKALQNI